eukprot:2851145-Pleurochrysis_carterae.AAC.2
MPLRSRSLRFCSTGSNNVTRYAGKKEHSGAHGADSKLSRRPKSRKRAIQSVRGFAREERESE